MPTAGDYEVEFYWIDSNTPRAELQESIWWGKGEVCKVRLDEIEVSIYVDGDDLLTHRETGERYRTASELDDLGIDTDQKLYEAIGDNGYLDQENNSWFDVYTAQGEHLDMVHHEADEAFESACGYVIDQFVNLCQIENNQIPQIEGKKVVVVDFEE